MQLEFIAAVQIIVYVGGIVVLIIFSIFLTQKAGSEMPKPVRNRAFFTALAVLPGFILSYTLIYQHNFQPQIELFAETTFVNFASLRKFVAILYQCRDLGH